MECVIHNEDGRAIKMAGEHATIQNVELTLQNTRYEVVLPKDTTRFTVQARSAADVKMATSQADTKYLTIKSGASYSEDGLSTSVSLWFETAAAGTIIEIVSWA